MLNSQTSKTITAVVALVAGIGIANLYVSTTLADPINDLKPQQQTETQAFETEKPLLDQAEDGINDAAETTADYVEPTVDSAREAANDAGEAISKAASDAADAASDAYEAAEPTIEKAKETTASVAQDAWTILKPGVERFTAAVAEAMEEVEDEVDADNDGAIELR